MGQSDRLPKIKKIELTNRQMRPPQGSKSVGQLDDGTVIWEGPIFAGNPLFQDHASGKIDKGFERRPVMDPINPDQQRWKRNNRGEPVTPMFKNRRKTKIARFIMVDEGNGNAGPRPVPSITAAERAHRDNEAGRSEYERDFFAAAQAEGIPAGELVKKIAALSKPMPEKRGPGRPPKSAPEPDEAA